MPVAIIRDYSPDDVYDESDSSMGYRSMKCGGGDSQAAHVGDMCSSRAHPDAVTTIRTQREREGRCGDCGMQTHQMHVDPLTHCLVKVPLTIEREVHRGRCLFCHPVFAHQLFGHQLSCHSSTVPISSVSSPHDQLSQSNHEKPSSSPEPSRSRSVNRSVSSDSMLFARPSRHDRVDPVVREALSIINGSSFDIVDILSAMNRVPHDMTVQESGCERLWILSWEEDNSAAIGRVGGISIILNAMARFPLNAHLQQCGCESLQNLALSDYNRGEICDLSGVHLIVQAMVRHARVAGIQQCGCTALASIATGKMHSHVIEQAGGLNAILNAARNFADEESVLEAAYDALRAMGLNAGGRITPTPEEEEDSQSSLIEDNTSSMDL